MFIRFVSGEIDEQSHVAAGLFCAAGDLIDEVPLPDYVYTPLGDLLTWFGKHLAEPFTYRLRSPRRASRAICWFKSDAYEHLSRAREMIAILEEQGVFMRTVRTNRAGYILYEDNAQILAEPFADIRPMLRR